MAANIKDPEAVLDYGWDWAAPDRGRIWLADGDSITESTWTIEGPDDDLEVVTDTHDDTTTTIWLRGGTLGKAYKATNHVTTADGRKDDRTLRITITSR